jgi:folate-dependent tRNA-U54 methylase TrmFO/GidA
MTSSAKTVHIVGGGLAGSEAAWQLASAGVPVVLHEMRPVRRTEAHQTDALAELVCSNSFRSDDWAGNAVGLLHEEMRRAGSLILAAADDPFVPAEQFHDAAVRDNPNVHVYVAPHGGHCAFLSPDGYWAETTAMDFLTTAMPMTDRAR